MKKILLILAAMVMSANCLVSCGDDEKNEEDINERPYIHGMRVQKLNPNETTTINAMFNHIHGLEGYVVVPAKTSEVLLRKNYETIYTYIDPLNIYVSFGSHLEVPSQEVSVIFSQVYIYPTSLAKINIKEEGIDSLDLYLKSDEIDGLDLTFKYIDDAIVKDGTYEDKALHLKLDRYSTIWGYFNAKFEVVSSDTVAIEAKPKENGTLKCKWGVEKPTGLENNSIISNVLINIFGTSKMKEDVKVDDVNASYQQEVVTLKLISGSRTFNLKVYGKPFKIDN